MFGHETNKQNCSIQTGIKFTTMDDKVVGTNNGKLVIHAVTCMIMICSYVPRFSRRCTSCQCIRNRMAGSTQGTQWCSPMVSGRVIYTFCQISDFLRQFYTFSKFSLIFKWPKSEETSMIGDLKTKTKKEKLILGAKTRFCGNSHIYLKLI